MRSVFGAVSVCLTVLAVWLAGTAGPAAAGTGELHSGTVATIQDTPWK